MAQKLAYMHETLCMLQLSCARISLENLTHAIKLTKAEYAGPCSMANSLQRLFTFRFQRLDAKDPALANVPRFWV